jgi:hypothetical protein
MNTWVTSKDTDYTKPQFSVFQLDLGTGKVKNEYHFINNKFHFKFQFLLSSSSIEVVCNELASVGKFYSGVISCIKIDLGSFSANYKRTKINLFDIVIARPKSAKVITSVMDYSFRVEKNAKGEYVFFIRGVSEKEDFEVRSNGMTIQKFDVRFGSSVVLLVDSLFENVISKQSIDNKIIMLNSFMSFIYQLNNRTYDITMYTLPSDSGKYLLAYLVNSDIWGKDGNGLSVKLNNTGDYNFNSVYTIGHAEKKVKDFEHASVEELTKGVFIIKVSLWGASDNLLIIKTD